MLLCEEAQHTGPGLATLGEIVLVQPGSIALKRDRVKVQGEGAGLAEITQALRRRSSPRVTFARWSRTGAIGVVGHVGFLGRHIEARKQATGLVDKVAMWLRRSLSNSFRTSKLNNALVAGTIVEPG